MVGNPVSHSRSPRIHEAAFDAVGLRAEYQTLEVDEEGMRTVVTSIRDGDLDGINVTMPHKKLAHDLCDRVSPDAARAQSVNTIVEENGQIQGYSTDITGLARTWRENGLPTDAPVLVLGSGGAAAAAVIALNLPEVYGSTRREEAVAELTKRTGSTVVPVPWASGVTGAVVINATPLGMEGETLPEAVTAVWSGVVDMPYTAGDTPAVLQARDDEVPVVDGLDLLVAQAAESFTLWTGVEAPVEVMTQAARG